MWHFLFFQITIIMIIIILERRRITPAASWARACKCAARPTRARVCVQRRRDLALPVFYAPAWRDEGGGDLTILSFSARWWCRCFTGDGERERWRRREREGGRRRKGVSRYHIRTHGSLRARPRARPKNEIFPLWLLFRLVLPGEKTRYWRNSILHFFSIKYVRFLFIFFFVFAIQALRHWIRHRKNGPKIYPASYIIPAAPLPPPPTPPQLPIPTHDPQKLHPCHERRHTPYVRTHARARIQGGTNLCRPLVLAWLLPHGCAQSPSPSLAGTTVASPLPSPTITAPYPEHHRKNTLFPPAVQCPIATPRCSNLQPWGTRLSFVVVVVCYRSCERVENLISQVVVTG